MADSNKVDISFNAETGKASGDVRKFKGEIETIGPSGKKAAASISGSFKTIETAIGRVRKIMSTISFATLWINAIADIIGKFKEWRGEAERTAEKTRELQKAAADKAAAENVREIAEAYKELSRAISDVAEKRSRQNELFKEKVGIRRDAEDAETDAAEAEELAGVDPGAADADRQRAAIRERYAANRARRNAERKKHDIVMRREDLNRQAEDATAAADKIESSLSADDDAISRTRRKAATLEAQSNERNEKDGVWYNRSKRTEAGDEVRNRQRQESEKLREEVKRLEKEKAEKERQVAELREKASNAREMHDALGSALDTADIRRQTETVREDTAAGIRASAAQKEADKAAAEKKKKEEEEAAAEAARASALAAAPELAAQADSLKSRIAAEQARKNAAGLGVFQAQNALDLARANGDPTGGATAALQSAQMAANEVNASADAAIAALTETLKSVEARLKAAQNFLEKQSSQSTYAWEDGNAAGA